MTTANDHGPARQSSMVWQPECPRLYHLRKCDKKYIVRGKRAYDLLRKVNYVFYVCIPQHCLLNTHGSFCIDRRVWRLSIPQYFPIRPIVSYCWIGHRANLMVWVMGNTIFLVATYELCNIRNCGVCVLLELPIFPNKYQNWHLRLPGTNVTKIYV